jgi:hypothetical protein
MTFALLGKGVGEGEERIIVKLSPDAGTLPALNYCPDFYVLTHTLRAPKTCDLFQQRAFPTTEKMSAQTPDLLA